MKKERKGIGRRRSQKMVGDPALLLFGPKWVGRELIIQVEPRRNLSRVPSEQDIACRVCRDAGAAEAQK